MDGFINILKPQGPTASDMVVRLRGILKQKKIGHLGTLDPGACGVLPIAVGKGTKLFDFLVFKRKKIQGILYLRQSNRYFGFLRRPCRGKEFCV